MSLITSLYELQLTDTRLAEIASELDALDDGSQLRVETEQMETTVEQCRKRVREYRRDIRDAELELSTVDQKLEGSEKQLSTGQVRVAREVQRLQEEIDAFRRQREGLEDRTLNMMEETDTLEAQLKEDEQKLMAMTAELKQTETDSGEILGRLNKELEQLNADRAEKTPSIDEDLLEKYDLIRRIRNDNRGVVLVDGNSCDGCHVILTADARRQLYDPEATPTCQNCSRILYQLTDSDEIEDE